MTTTTHDNYHQAELDKFAALANRWWDAEGPQRALHVLNPVRLDYVKQRLPAPGLHGQRVLDVGCGGGLLSEALAKEGAQVTAIDLAPELVKVARLHGLESGVKVDYQVKAVEVLAEERPGGRLFLSTLNRTPAAFALAIVGAEYVARLLPRGTHHYDGFIKPSELAAWLRAAGLQLEDVSGLFYDPLRQRARLSTRTDVNYLACAARPGVAA